MIIQVTNLQQSVFNIPSIVWRFLGIPDPIHDPSSLGDICPVMIVDRGRVVRTSPQQVIVAPAVTEFVKIIKIKPDAACEIFQLLKQQLSIT